MFYDVEELQLDAEAGETAGGDDVAYAAEEILSRLAGKACDQMCDDAYTAVGQSGCGVVICLQRIAAADMDCRPLVGGLETELDPEECPAVQLGKIGDDFVAETVRTCGDGQSHAGGMRKSFFIFLAQHRERCISICKILEICNSAEFLPFFSESFDLDIDLLRDLHRVSQESRPV